MTHWIIIGLAIVGILFAYGVAQEMINPITNWWNTQLNGQEYCPDGNKETVSLAVQSNGIGAEYTKVKDGRFCFRTKDSVLAGRIIQQVEDRKLQENQIKIIEDAKTDRLLLLILGAIIIIAIFFANNNYYASL